LFRHKEEIESLKHKDPEFYQFLQENDQQTLGFGDDDDDNDDYYEEDDIDDNKSVDSEIDDNDENNIQQEQVISDRYHGVKVVHVNKSLLKSITDQAYQNSFSATRKLMAIFRIACSPNNDDEDDDDENDGESSSKRSTYVIDSPESYNYVMTNILNHAHIIFLKLLGMESVTLSMERNQLGNEFTKNSKWKKLNASILSFFKSILLSLSTVALSSNYEVTVYILNSLEPYIKFLAPLPRLTSKVMKTLLSIWSHGPNPNEDITNVRGYAFIRIRQLSRELPGSIVEECFRSLYLTYARECKSFTELTAPSVSFMMECILELYHTDITIAYQQAFVYIRQLALHLRAALLKVATSEFTNQLSSWQYLNCIRLWTKLICALPKMNELGPLTFPLVQIIFGLMSLTPSLYFVPLKFHLISCLHQLAAHTEAFIPTIPKLMDIILNPEFVTKSTPSTALAPQLQYIVRLPTNSIGYAAVRDLIISESITLIQQDADIYRFHVAFPEYIFLTIKKLKSFSKVCKISKWRDLVKTLVNQLEEYSEKVKKQRVSLGKAPIDIKEFEPLLQKGDLNAKERIIKSLKSRGVVTNSGVIIDTTDKNPITVTAKKRGKGYDEKGITMNGTKEKDTQASKQLKRKINDDDNDMIDHMKSTNDSKKKLKKKNDKKMNLNNIDDEIKKFEWSDSDDE
jgi:nucleolar complex protein 2